MPKRQRNAPWKGIYGTDRKYTARVDRARERDGGVMALSPWPRGMTAEDVWAALEAEPGFNEAMEQGRRDIAEGRGTPFREVRRES